MECKISDVKTFKDCVMVSSEVLFEFHIMCDKDGMRWTGLDKSHVSFIECVLSSEFFVEYTCHTPVEIVIDGGEFQKVIKRCNNSDDIMLVSDDYKLHVKYLNDNGERNFELNYIDDVENSFNLPDIPFSRNNVPVPFKTLFEYMDDCLLYTNHVKLEFIEDTLNVTAAGDLGAYKGKIKLDEEYNGATVSGVFNIDKLKIFKKFSTFDELYLCLGHNMPCLFMVKDVLDNIGFKLMVAPRIMQD